MRRFWIYFYDPLTHDWPTPDLVMIHPSSIRDLLLDYESLGLLHPYEVAV